MNTFLLLRKYLPMFWWPAIISTIASLAWYLIPQELIYNKGKGSTALFFAISNAFIAHTILASVLMNKLYMKHAHIKQAIRQRNKPKYDDLIESNIVDPMEVVILIISLGIIFLTIMIPEESTVAGMICSFSTIFIISFWWRILHELDDPFSGICKISKPSKDHWEK